ncbi:capsular polysaccharide synthesis protein [Riemerella columbina]|uniref:capsular polysaccharide synthesis protein n=1 Tax=Riemerella columbina TaxID=103810 RepID=UPI00037AD707|nr:capsular polysaccharide synthesis protein [Riemerella columbina]
MLNTIALKLKKLFPNTYQNLLNIKQGRYNYTFKKEKYPHSFLVNTPVSEYKEKPAPEVIYCFWTGNNPLTENRKKGLEALEKNAGIPVKLITPKNLPDYIKSDTPLHKGYELLSLVHRADYLRCYFMHHYGGGYADIKPFEKSWKSAFKKINSNKNKYILGYPELLYGGIAPLEANFLQPADLETKKGQQQLYKDLVKYTPLLIGNCSYICKPYSPITTEWYRELHSRMDECYDILLSSNSENESLGYEDKHYPIPYFYLLGQIFHPIILKYHKHVLRDKRLLPILKNYR